MALRKVALGAAIVAILAACSQAGSVSDERPAAASVTYRAETQDYKLHILPTNPATPYDVLVSATPDGAAPELIFDDVTGGELVWTPQSDTRARRYFIVQVDGAPSVMTATRLLPLEGGRNFRDLGGYATEDGRTVRWGQIFRSGVMDQLTDADYDYLSGLGIRTVCDFRTHEERTLEPTVWTAGPIDYLTFADPAQEDDANPLAAVFSQDDVKPDDVRAGMSELYLGILEQQTPAYRVMFDELANGEIPLTFNCSAGKDRTGIGAALLLSVLGVDRETVIADYALSEKVVDYAAAFSANESHSGEEEDGPYAFLRRLPPELVAPLLRSDPQYIRNLLQQIETEHGSVTKFVQIELGVEDDELEAIRDRLLH